MYSIGEFSKIVSISIKALRLYHEKGVLTPSYVDQTNGYRYYSARDVEKARAISYLKELTFSLAEIQAILSDFSDESELISFFRAKQQSVLDQADRLTDVSEKIDEILKKEMEIRQMNELQDFEVKEKEMDEQLVLAARWSGRYKDTGKAFSKLFRRAGRHSTGTPLNLYYDAEYKEDEADIESCIPIKKEIDGKEHVVKTLSKGRCRSAMHRGPYEEIGRTYEKLFAHAKKHNVAMAVPYREIYIKGPGMLLKGNPNNYLTEIQIPID